MPNFEDALLAAAAVACGAQVILARNVRDFKRSSVLAMTPEDFIKQNMPAKPPRPADAPQAPARLKDNAALGHPALSPTTPTRAASPP